MKSLLLSLVLLTGTAAAQVTTGAITQTGKCQIAGVIGNPSIVCQDVSAEVVRRMNQVFSVALKSKDTQIQTLTKEANDWKDLYLSTQQRDLTTRQRTEVDSLLDQGKVDEARQVLSSLDAINKKLDNLSSRMDCSGATVEAFSLAIKALDADRVLTLWHCRPEDTTSSNVQTPYVLLFTNEKFPTAKPFLDKLVAGGFNPLRDIKPLPGPITGPSESGVLLMRYFFAPIDRPLIDGNIDAIQWIIDHAPPGYWSSYNHLMIDLPSIMRLPWANIPTAKVTQAITMLRKAGVPAEVNDYQPFRDAYRKWLETQMPDDLQTPLVQPTGAAAIYARKMTSMYGRPPQPRQYANLWKAVSDAFAPTAPADLHKAKLKTMADMESGAVNAADQQIAQLTNQLQHQAWWRKLPETQALIYEARRRQSLNPFDSYGYVPVASGDLQDTDLLPSFTKAPVGYPNCDCSTAADLRSQLAKASQRKELLLQFESKYSQ